MAILNRKPKLIRNFSQVRALVKAKISTSKTDNITTIGKHVNAKNKSLGSPKQDLPLGFTKRKANKTKAIIITRKTTNLVTK